MSLDDQHLQAVVIDAFTAFNKTHFDRPIQGSGIPVRTSRGGFAMSLDCASTNQRIVIALGPEKPTQFSMAVADKSAPEKMKSETLPLAQLNAATVLAFMEKHFV